MRRARPRQPSGHDANLQKKLDTTAGSPLDYAAELVLDGRTLAKPVNYA